MQNKENTSHTNTKYKNYKKQKILTTEEEKRRKMFYTEYNEY